MNENSVAREVEVEKLEMIDLGDVKLETRQPDPVHMIKENAITWTWFAE